jgi:hypothetical protein
MTHRPYTPPAWQSKPLADGRVTLLVVPLRPASGYQSTWLSPEILQAAPSCYLIENNGRLGAQMRHPKANKDNPMSPLTWVALPYSPGDLIWCREAYIGAYAYEVNEYKPKDWGNKPSWFPADGPIPERFVGQFWHKARSPVTMPKWAARTWLRCTGVEVRRVRTLRVQEVRRIGLVPEDEPDMNEHIRDFAANPWAAFVTIEKISKEDV